MSFLSDLWARLTLSSVNSKLDQIIEKDDQIMAKADDIRTLAADSQREIGQIKTFITDKQTKLDAALARIEELLAQDAEDAEIRAALDEAMPTLRAGVDELDKFTPETTGDGGTGDTGGEPV